MAGAMKSVEFCTQSTTGEGERQRPGRGLEVWVQLFWGVVVVVVADVLA